MDAVRRLFAENKQYYRVVPIALAILLLIAEIIDDIILNNWHIDRYILLEIIVIVSLVALFWREVGQREKAEEIASEAQQRSERLAGDLVDHIESRFRQWQLSQAEHDIAWLLLKGFSFTEAAEIRGVKEKTLRQQATRIYAKGNIAGRSELAATFLQDILLTREERLQYAEEDIAKQHTTVS